MTLEFNPLTSLLSVFGALGVAALIGWIKMARLVVLVPKTFSYSELTESGNGQLVEIAVFNRGWKTEDTIDVTMNPALTYQMLGANSQDVKVEQNRLKISRIAPSDEITALIIVEKGIFRREDIVQIVSKDSKGVTVSKAEEIGPTGQQRVQFVVALVVMLLLGGGSYLAVQSSIAQPPQQVGLKASDAKEEFPAKVGGWTIESHYRTKDNALYQAVLSGKIKLVVGSPQTKGDNTTIPVRVSNSGPTPFVITLSMNTNASVGRIPSHELRTFDHMVPVDQTIERSIRVIVPIRSSEAADRSVYIEAFLKTLEGESLMLKQVYIKAS
ncbi:hypothetical protein GCN74_21690 [Janthinobacterium sp. FT14W]|uniref:hypothetical protein n=1 Tax=Janthinobacterium sp. FT14W TaxID=2654253 RepID=UPI001264E16B|nr:hypothetical protein [Janthinobacterium sp. FT14W]KAB8057183.1 hypothetical protein GCN74_21690 [Janthinobacterium sp. FT14W]